MAKSGKIGVLLVNLGTPDSTKTGDVRKYLREFLMDGRVIDFPFIPRWMLVNLIIAPFRAPKSAKEYRKLWTDRGSPLLFHTEDLKEKLVAKLDAEEYLVSMAMRYQSPSIESGLKELMDAKVRKIIVLPLFPQYASATNGSVIDKVMEIARGWQIIPEITFISNFVEHPLFIQAWEELGKEMMQQDQYDRYLFSYHGLPERQIRKGSVDNYCKLGACCNKYGPKNQFCYRAQCFHTTRLVAAKLGLPEDKVMTCFQSRLGKDPWIKPYTEDVIKELAEQGVKKVLVFSPAFVADCLETTVEVGEEYKEEFEELGGEKWDLVPSLNSTDTWIDCVKDLVETHS
ncbi:MAG TPA: ferrochelatase [Algoriphagus sp.]|jgi:ferrochelatase|uniref:ferrochelatase n=1 Tax=unclassified Algoriphagus TaxID=2641541 RepID=UPI000C552BFB|nr:MULTISPECIES: ferrochelatase [unclassified Algoriphagus]MAL13291.1 ferrochelatase [Algoriphagus sp.]QYH40100.1 ferrochelatase [Algoriphagus sp. NBT04N3]HAD52190.1 ferrochelatase [Algoriphagus sp.]HAH37197.1 ferrochelatase [Algoriphagus sp.]HAS57985.1 ferrochelatase [Algoriphagus sp.]|tara:strand:+ start:1067 stop:2095 length:1029 start_codon:yes stop_codon:yes gene_type:complete